MTRSWQDMAVHIHAFILNFIDCIVGQFQKTSHQFVAIYYNQLQKGYSTVSLLNIFVLMLFESGKFCSFEHSDTVRLTCKARFGQKARNMGRWNFHNLFEKAPFDKANLIERIMRTEPQAKSFINQSSPHF